MPSQSETLRVDEIPCRLWLNKRGVVLLRFEPQRTRLSLLAKESANNYFQCTCPKLPRSPVAAWSTKMSRD